MELLSTCPREPHTDRVEGGRPRVCRAFRRRPAAGSGESQTPAIGARHGAAGLAGGRRPHHSSARRAARARLPHERIGLGRSQGDEAVVSRELLEMVCDDLLARALQPVYAVLRDAGVHPSEVDDVVMVGGSSRLVAVSVVAECTSNGSRRARSHCGSMRVARGWHECRCSSAWAPSSLAA